VTNKASLLRIPACFIAAILLSVIVMGCDVFLRENDIAERYTKALDRWTAEDEIYRDLEAKILVTGTYKSVPFRRAYVEKYAADYHLSAGEAKTMLAQQETLAKGHHEFLLAIFTPTKMEDGLDERNSAWRVYLEGPGFDKLEPFEIRRVRKYNARLTSFFPYVTPWAKVYEVRFEVPETTVRAAYMNLVLTGVIGTVNLGYQLED
jgi:hypothetical protein